MTRRFSASTIHGAGLSLLVIIALAGAATSALRAQARPRASAGSRKALSVNIVNHDFWL
jgi:hypothetical protein